MYPPQFTTTAVVCPCSIWTPDQAPVHPSADDLNAVELGLRFRTSVAGFITGIRFYKGTSNVGPHVGNLWTNSGTLLGTVTFTDESASGWQEAVFGAPIAVTANTTYVVSYHTDSGGYAADQGYFQAASVINPPLQALANGIDGANGVFRYGPSAFPTDTPSSTNYWVDVVFSTTAVDTVPPTVTSVTPGGSATSVTTTTAITATFSEAMNPASVTGSTIELRDPSNTLVPGVWTYRRTDAPGHSPAVRGTCLFDDLLRADRGRCGWCAGRRWKSSRRRRHVVVFHSRAAAADREGYDRR